MLKTNYYNKITCLLRYCALVFCTFHLQVYAQVSNTYVHSGAKIHQFSGEKTSVWGNATNEGQWSTAEGGITVFYGTLWKNDNLATLPGAGSFEFIQPRPAPYGNNAAQSLDGGYNTANNTGCSFPDLLLNNSNNLTLLNTDVKVRDTFNFVNGHTIVSSLNIVVGNGNPGDILGFDENSYFVTNSSGYLYREVVGNDNQDYPIGIAINDYTPASISNSGLTDRFGIRVFSGVYENGTTGTDLSNLSVGRTWDVVEEITGGSNVTLALQHNVITEGVDYDNSSAFVSHYIGTAPNNSGDTTSNSKWDLVKYSSLSAGTSTGNITTGSAIANASVLLRTNITSFSPFTKSGYNNTYPVPVELIDFKAKWITENALIEWSTASEINNNYFLVQRRIEGENWETIALVNSKAENGNSNQLVKYEFIDEDIKQFVFDVVYYRLHQFDFNGENEIHGPVSLNVDQESLGVLSQFKLYPNPASESARIAGTGVHDSELSFTLVDKTGRVISQSSIDVNQGNFAVNVPLIGLSTGVYYVVLKGNKTVFSERLIVN